MRLLSLVLTCLPPLIEETNFRTSLLDDGLSFQVEEVDRKSSERGVGGESSERLTCTSEESPFYKQKKGLVRRGRV